MDAVQIFVVVYVWYHENIKRYFYVYGDTELNEISKSEFIFYLFLNTKYTQYSL